MSDQDAVMTDADQPAPSAASATAQDGKPDYTPEPDEIYRADLMAVHPVPNAGLGLFATAPIPSGTCLIRESPLLTLPESADLPDLFALLQALPASRLATFRALAAHRRRDDGADWIPAVRAAYAGDSAAFDAHCDAVLAAWFVYETNRFTVRGPGGARDRMGLFPAAARLNHSCRPNVFHRHNHLIGRLTIFALRDIGVGEQVCTSYIDVARPAGERARLLRHWGFRCGCVLCARPEEASEERRRRLEEMMARMKREEMKRPMKDWGGREYGRALAKLEQMAGLMAEEALDESDTLGEVLGLQAEYYMGVGRWREARASALKALEIEQRCLGQDSSEWHEANTRLLEAEKGVRKAGEGGL